MSAKQYRPGFVRRAANALIRVLLTLGIPMSHTYMLCVRGRRSGEVRATPVRLVEDGMDRWLVSPYGEVDWVRNVRATSRVQLKRGRSSESVTVVELPATEAAPILRTYVREVSIVRPFFDAGPESSLADFEREAPRHPVFQIVKSRVNV
jgi:deazaflavin-dependent oxidoreductase (nitroreductase family)